MAGKGNTAIGQAKKVYHTTPIFCSDWDAADLSLGVMKDGAGSMSTQDMWFVVEDADVLKTLTAAVASGALVNVTYDDRRFSWCRETAVIRSVEFSK